MAVLPITLYGDKILRKKAVKVEEVDNNIVGLISNMFDTMRNASGIGLAANQVGSDKAIFIVDLSVVEEYQDSKPLVIINPVIVERSEQNIILEEGCLSIPDVRADIERPDEIKIKFLDTNLKVQQLSAQGLLARVMQHEFDHLKGIYFTDLVDEETKKKLKKTLGRISSRKIDIDYPVTENVDYQLK